MNLENVVILSALIISLLVIFKVPFLKRKWLVRGTLVLIGLMVVSTYFDIPLLPQGAFTGFPGQTGQIARALQGLVSSDNVAPQQVVFQTPPAKSEFEAFVEDTMRDLGITPDKKDAFLQKAQEVADKKESKEPKNRFFDKKEYEDKKADPEFKNKNCVEKTVVSCS